MKKNKINKISVTKPSLPELNEFIPYLESIWDSKWLTNNGQFHKELENKLTEFLGVKHISLCSNGTLALMLALKALDCKGEIITTPFSFVATSHAIKWLGCTPVFADIDPVSLNMDPDKIEALITDKTTAIMPVHVYGNPCDHEKIRNIADKYDLKLIYDAAHAFNVRQNNESILNWGDHSVLSFHATKVFNTFEGGAVISPSESMKKKIDDLKNFGFQNETTVTEVGINAKMNEVQAAMGLAQLKHVEENIKKRKNLAARYTQKLRNIPGLRTVGVPADVTGNYSYYPILVDDEQYGNSRDDIYDRLKENNILARKYFYPLISDFEMYKNLPSASGDNLPTAKTMSERVLCLPIYPEMDNQDIDRIVNILKDL
jgi:dTDP-4-amino-4,6-dideoxygalactose transaminase